MVTPTLAGVELLTTRKECDMTRWQPRSEHQMTLSESLVHLGTGGQPMQAASEVLLTRLRAVGGGQRGHDEVMAVRYAMNAVVHAWEVSDEATRTHAPALLVEVFRSLREATELYRSLREDDDGFGAATLRGVAHDLAVRLGVTGDPLTDPLTAPASRYEDAADELLTAFDSSRWHPGYFEGRFKALTLSQQRTFLQRSRNLAAYVDNVIPARAELGVFLAFACVLCGELSLASLAWRGAMVQGQPIIEATLRDPTQLGGLLNDLFRHVRVLSEQLNSLDPEHPLTQETVAVCRAIDRARAPQSPKVP